MLKGVTDKEYSIIKDILKDYNGEFFAYGSRVRGDFTELSDLDIMVKSTDFEKFLPQLKDRFDNSFLPYVVNFVDFATLDEKFYRLIEKDLVKISF